MDEIKTITDFFTSLFTPSQQAAISIISLVVLVATHNFKVIWFGFYPERRTNRKTAIIRLFAVSFGLICGVIGYYIGAKQPLWFWLVCSVLSSGGAILIVDVYKKFIVREKKS